MAPASGEAVSVMTPGQQREISETVTAVTSQKVSFTSSLKDTVMIVMNNVKDKVSNCR
jgi:hypothetical protein